MLAQGNTYERLKKIVVEQLGVDEGDVKPEASFVDDLNADSLDLVELIMSLEEEFGMEISDDEAEKIKTVGDAPAAVIIDEAVELARMFGSEASPKFVNGVLATAVGEQSGREERERGRQGSAGTT